MDEQLLKNLNDAMAFAAEGQTGFATVGVLVELVKQLDRLNQNIEAVTGQQGKMNFIETRDNSRAKYVE